MRYSEEGEEEVPQNAAAGVKAFEGHLGSPIRQPSTSAKILIRTAAITAQDLCLYTLQKQKDDAPHRCEKIFKA